MKYGFVGLDGVYSDPRVVLEKVLMSYFHSDTIKHGIDVPTHSLRSDMVDSEDIAGNIQRSLDEILQCYFDVYTVETTDNGNTGNVKSIALEVTATVNGRVITFDNVLNMANGELKGIVEQGHL